MIEPCKTTSPLDEAPSIPVPETLPIEADRREALRRVGRFSAYAAPAVLAMMSSTQAVAAS